MKFEETYVGMRVKSNDPTNRFGQVGKITERYPDAQYVYVEFDGDSSRLEQWRKAKIHFLVVENYQENEYDFFARAPIGCCPKCAAPMPCNYHDA